MQEFKSQFVPFCFMVAGWALAALTWAIWLFFFLLRIANLLRRYQSDTTRYAMVFVFALKHGNIMAAIALPHTHTVTVSLFFATVGSVVTDVLIQSFPIVPEGTPT
jgi:hypothetical protein